MPFRGRTEDVARLRSAIGESRRDLVAFREHRNDLLRQYVGRYYGYRHQSAKERVPINLLERTVHVYTMMLAGEMPQVLVRSWNPREREYCKQIQQIINREVQSLGLDVIIQEAVIDACFCQGMIKVGQDYSGELLVREGRVLTPFAEIVHLDDWVQDLAVKKYQHGEYAGDLYNVPVDLVEERVRNGFYNRGAAEKLSATDNIMVDEVGMERIQAMSTVHQTGQHKYRPFVRLWDVWIPEERLIVTIPGDHHAADVVLRIVEYDGPKEGPYKILGFFDVPDNPLPIAPISQLLDLHQGVNFITRKLMEQALRQRTIYGFQPGSDSEAVRIRDTADGGLVEMEDPSRVQEYRIGAIDQQAQALSMYLENEWDRQAGNLSALAGLRAQTRTLGQEQQLLGQASQHLNIMRKKTQAFTASVIRDLAWRWWSDTERTFQGSLRIGESQATDDFEITPEERQEFDIRDLSIQVEPYSMQFRSPEERLNTLVQIVQLAGQLGPLMAEQGGQVNMKKFFDLCAEYTAMPEIQEIVEFGQPAMMENEMRQSPVTERNYVRRSEAMEPQPQSVRDYNRMAGTGGQGNGRI